ncbi:hypothetical protein LEN26_010258 [Aphanomyces euteiches]|nr:hypothetical protein AeMF1_018505 [Aphanomyces euteiches]KAH9122430.1 hypothetical protein LEN26_010258 [Aphanomyces euteiches]KAH9194874.1 hypothetical protein AeNC1_003151 [Aphanomyces euteiches]
MTSILSDSERSSAISRVAKSSDHLTVEMLLNHEEWVPDHERHRCYVCTRNFSNFRRKHHCRRCGEVVCRSCLLKKMARLPMKGSLEVKICMTCILSDTQSHDSTIGTMRRRDNSTTASSRSSRSTDVMTHLQSPTANSTGERETLTMDGLEADEYPLDYSWNYPWPKPPVLPDDGERVDVLRSYNILDTDPEEKFDITCTLAANAIKCPIAVVSFIDEDRQWFKANVGLAQSEIPRNVSLCAHAIKSKETMVVWNTMLDKRFAKNPLVTGPASIRFYAGAPIVAPSGHVIGTVAVFDNQPRQSVDIAALEKLSTVVMKHLEERRMPRMSVAPPLPLHPVARDDSEIASRRYSQPPPRPVTPPEASQMAPRSSLHEAVVSVVPPSTAVAAPAAVALEGSNMETMLMNLLSKTTETQQQLATQQGAMFTTLGQHSAQIDKLADAVARIEAKLK